MFKTIWQRDYLLSTCQGENFRIQEAQNQCKRGGAGARFLHLAVVILMSWLPIDSSPLKCTQHVLTAVGRTLCCGFNPRCSTFGRYSQKEQVKGTSLISPLVG